MGRLQLKDSPHVDKPEWWSTDEWATPQPSAFVNSLKGCMKSEILAVLKVRKPGSGWWLMLDCSHWYKWTGDKALSKGGELDCPSCSANLIAPGTRTSGAKKFGALLVSVATAAGSRPCW